MEKTLVQLTSSLGLSALCAPFVIGVVIELSYKEESWRRSNREVPVAQVVRAPARNVGDLGSTPGGAFIFAYGPLSLQ